MMRALLQPLARAAQSGTSLAPSHNAFKGLSGRRFASPSVTSIQELPVSFLQRILNDGNIDHRHCIEKQDLAALVSNSYERLPSTVQNEVNSLVKAPPRELLSREASAALSARVGRLFPDEQYSVRLFQEARHSVAHITTLRQAAVSLLNPSAQQPGTGSGFVWDTNGHIVTNFHVIMDSSDIKVTLSNQRTARATLVGQDPANDIAVLKINEHPASLVPIKIGTSHDLMVGQNVFAIGNPFGLDQTLTAGIVSSTNRQIHGVSQRIIRDVVQTDAAINPGNSGGPLLDSQGRLIGVNTMIYSPSGQGSVGIGFAVPVNTVRRSVTQIIRYGQVRRGKIGLLMMADQTASQLQQAFGWPPGVVVHGVEPGSGSEQAGIRGFRRDDRGEAIPGDLIVAVGGERVTSSEALATIVEHFNVGDLVPITVLRAGQELTLNVPLLERKDER